MSSQIDFPSSNVSMGVRPQRFFSFMNSFIVIVIHPLVQIFLKFLYIHMEFLAECDLVRFVQGGLWGRSQIPLVCDDVTSVLVWSMSLIARCGGGMLISATAILIFMVCQNTQHVVNG